MRTLSSTAITSIMAENTGEVWLFLLTITHPSITDTLYFVNNNEALTSRGNVYIPFPFTVELPTEDSENLGEVRLKIDNIDRSIVKALRSIDSPPSVTLEVVLASQPDTIEASFSGMLLRNANWDAPSVTASLKFEDIGAEPMSLQMTPQRFPGMF